MTRVVETNDSGSLTIPPDPLGEARPHTRFIVEAIGDALMLRPESAPLPRDLPPAERAREFREWIVSLPRWPGPDLSDEALSRESVYPRHGISRCERRIVAVRTKRMKTCVLVIASAIAIATMPRGSVLAQTDASYHRGKRTLELALKCPSAMRLAHERYQLVELLRSQDATGSSVEQGSPVGSSPAGKRKAISLSFAPTRAVRS